MSGERVDITPEPTAAEAEAIRRALEALGLLERDGSEGENGVESDPASNASRRRHSRRSGV